MAYTDQEIIEMIPISAREIYGTTDEEIVRHYKSAHPELAVDLDDQYAMLTYIMECVVDAMQGHAYALKGGYVLRAISKNARYTRDVDMSISSQESFEILKKGFIKAGETFLLAGASSYRIREIEEKNSGGLCVVRNGVELVAADVSIQDLSYGIRLHDTKFYCYTFERMLLDKLKISLSSKVFRRMKDLYDIYLIVSNFAIDLEELRYRLRENEIYLSDETSPFNPDKSAQLAHAWNKFKVYASDGVSILDKPDFSDIMKVYLALTSKVF